MDYEIHAAAKELVELLKNRGLKLASCESCTGGLFAAAVTDIPGASEVFDRSLVTYSCEAKEQELGVKHETIEKYSAVSEQTAFEMAEGLHRVSGCDVCVSVTGYAGPGGGTKEDPAGTYYSGVYYGGKTAVFRHFKPFSTRSAVRADAVLSMINSIIDIISVDNNGK